MKAASAWQKAQIEALLVAAYKAGQEDARYAPHHQPIGYEVDSEAETLGVSYGSWVRVHRLGTAPIKDDTSKGDESDDTEGVEHERCRPDDDDRRAHLPAGEA